MKTLAILSLHLYLKLIAKGAESNIYLSTFFSRKAISKIRIPKMYRHQALDSNLRKHRTIHESKMLSLVKSLGIRTPFIYLVDPSRAEIVMEYVAGLNARDIINRSISLQIGKYISILHNNSIIHGDLTPSNFIVGEEMVILDFGLSYHSNRVEDKAVDIRLFGEILNGLYPRTYQSLYENFIKGYKTHSDNQDVTSVLKNVEEINHRRRYAVHDQ